MKKLSYNLHTPEISNNDIKSINNIVRKGWISTSGKIIEDFAKKLQNFLNIKYCIPVNSGTSALHLSLLSLGVNKDHEIIVPTVSFIAPINAVKYVGATPLFFDCDDYLNLDVNKIEKFLQNNTTFKNGKTINKKTKKIIRCLIVVHVFGVCADMEKIMSLCKKYNISCVEDSAESLGSNFISGKFKGYFSGTIGDIGCYSFNGNKIITTGSGGAVVTNSKKLAKKVFYLSNQAKENNVEFIHNDIGYNYRMNSISAALGISQLNSLNQFILKKKDNHKIYTKKFKNIDGIETIQIPSYCKSNYWLVVIKIELKKFNKKFDNLVDFLISNKINVRRLWKLNHIQKKYRHEFNYEIKNSKLMYKKCLCLPSNPSLSKKDIQYISNTIIAYLTK